MFRVLKRADNLRRNILHERPAKIDVERLHPVANRENRFVRAERVLADGEIGLLALRIRLGGFWIARCVVKRGVYVRWAARQHKGIQLAEKSLARCGIQPQRNGNRLATGFADRAAIRLVLAHLAGDLLANGAVRNADPHPIFDCGPHGAQIVASPRCRQQPRLKLWFFRANYQIGRDLLPN